MEVGQGNYWRQTFNGWVKYLIVLFEETLKFNCYIRRDGIVGISTYRVRMFPLVCLSDSLMSHGGQVGQNTERIWKKKVHIKCLGFAGLIQDVNLSRC